MTCSHAVRGTSQSHMTLPHCFIREAALATIVLLSVSAEASVRHHILRKAEG